MSTGTQINVDWTEADASQTSAAPPPARAVKSYPPAKQAYEDVHTAAGKASGDPKGPHNFYLDWGQGKPPWAEGKQPKESYGPFLNVADGDVPRGAMVRIRIYDLGGQNGKR